MATIQNNMQAVKARIAAACSASGRPESSVRLVAVSKTHPAESIRAAVSVGQRDFGENYVQEALVKIGALADLALVWHFIGPIQSNKARPIAESFHWVHSLDREKIATRLSEARPGNLPPLNVCIEVNVSGEPSKSGVAPQAVAGLARQTCALPRLRLRGLMAIPEPTSDIRLQRRQFRTLRELKDELVRSGLDLDTLSMGMSADMEAAIAEGSTMVRIGTAIFGPRDNARA
ncbi:MAG: YggS family pyridoxal phosphate enzyme [Betaproteobacteria bacterium RIFCSPLOWO2_02_FULL_63_19]|nr:MAG: YggS family pyridoxal phosphate enzyme [Betaproteobacteria bacterium RIFCSPLOWO2_02_FULL_63_19]